MLSDKKDREDLCNTLNWMFRFAADDAGDGDKIVITRREVKLVIAYIAMLSLDLQLQGKEQADA